MVKNILFTFIERADRINYMTLIPWSLDFINSSDAQFETSSSSKIQTLQLFYKYDTVTHSIGLVLHHHYSMSDEFGVVPCHQMLKKALKLDQVHTYCELSMSQVLEKIDLVTEVTMFNQLNGSNPNSKTLITIINLAFHRILAESNQEHKEVYDT